jgi:hypothetical protein
LNEATPAKPFSSRFRVIAPLVIVIAAICYYGSYLQFWFNPHDEGGTAAFIAMRLLEGESPFSEVELGYNVGWFWPIVGLFKLGGVNFLLMRAYFFALSTITALCGWGIVRRLTGKEWLALAVGLFLVVFPGSQFKNYIPLVCVANALTLVNAALSRSDSGRYFLRGVAVGGLVLGLTFLVRIDIGYLCTVMWIGLLVFRLFDVRFSFRDRRSQALAGICILLIGIVLTHVPAYIAAMRGGYARDFTRQYSGWANFLKGEAGALVTSETPGARGENAPAIAPKPKRGPKPDRTTLPRVSWATFTSFSSDKSALFVLTYLPVAMYAVLVIWAAVVVIRGIAKKTFTLDHKAMLALLLLGASLTTFGQFFFFRPDRPHLSEFMPGYVAAMVSVVWLLQGAMRWVIGGVLAMQLALFGWFALDHYSAGTIAARTMIKKNKRVLFEGANGVRVKVHQKTYAELEGVRKAVVEHSKPGDWLVCYPYQPGYNVMTDRRTYERELYNDNATAPRNWSKLTIASMDEKQPAVVIIDDRAINQVEASRFSKWAAPVYKHVKKTYGLVAKVDTIEIYSKDTVPAPEPEQVEEAPKAQ